MWFDSWSDIGRILLVGGAAYLALVVLVRVAGKRTLSQLSAFDFIVTVAFGSILATIILDSSVSWAEGVVALALLAILQLVVALSASRGRIMRTAVVADATYLLVDGRFEADALRKHRVTEGQVRQVVRASGSGDLTSVGAVLLEANGTFSVVPADAMGDRSALPPRPSCPSTPTT